MGGLKSFTSKGGGLTRLYLLGGMGRVLPPLAKNLLIPPPPGKVPQQTHPQIFISPTKDLKFSCSHSSCTIFILPAYSLHRKVMLILILINVQYIFTECCF